MALTDAENVIAALVTNLGGFLILSAEDRAQAYRLQTTTQLDGSLVIEAGVAVERGTE